MRDKIAQSSWHVQIAALTSCWSKSTLCKFPNFSIHSFHPQVQEFGPKDAKCEKRVTSSNWGKCCLHTQIGDGGYLYILPSTSLRCKYEVMFLSWISCKFHFERKSIDRLKCYSLEVKMEPYPWLDRNVSADIQLVSSQSAADIF